MEHELDPRPAPTPPNIAVFISESRPTYNVYKMLNNQMYFNIKNVFGMFLLKVDYLLVHIMQIYLIHFY
jgi:hypothetical protein